MIFMKTQLRLFAIAPLLFILLGATFLVVADRYAHQRLKEDTQSQFDNLMRSGLTRTQSLVISESMQSSASQTTAYIQEVGFIAVFLWGSFLIPMASRIASLTEKTTTSRPTD